MSVLHNLDLPTQDATEAGYRTGNRKPSSFVYASLVARIFPADPLNLTQPSRVIALVGAHPGCGVTHVCNECVSMLSNTQASESNCLSVSIDYRRLADHRSDLRSLVAEAIGPEMLYQRMEGEASISSLLGGIYGDWVADVRHRARCMAKLKEVFTYVFLDCPSLKEGVDLQVLAPLVDGIVVVVEADRTTESQLSYLVGAIEEARGTMLGLVFNKRHYAIPKRIYRKLETAGIA